MAYAKGGLKAASYGDAVTLAALATSSAQLKAACLAGANTANIKVYQVSVPSGAVAAKFALFQKDSGATDDHDLGVLAPDGTWSYSGNDGSNESVQLASPSAGSYKVCVVAYGSTTPQAMVHKLASWVVTPADIGGKFTVAVPGKVVAGNNTTVGVSWSGLADNQSYVGAAQFMDLNGVVQATTLVNVSTGAASVPTAEADRVAAAKPQD
jgi:hypothetical protein